MIYDRIMVRFGELGTKGKNKKDFISCLFKNIKYSLKDYSNLTFDMRFDHIYVVLNGENYEPIIDRLKDVSGIHSLSLVKRCNKDIEEIKQYSLEIMKEEEGNTFKVKAKRADKRFPIHSEEIVRIVAPIILKNTSFKVDVHNPDILLNIEVRDEASYISAKTFIGAGGYPLGIGGKAMMMLSGGIDSPVASYLIMRRGVMIECIHFASPPYTKDAVIYKLIDILKKLNKYQASIKLNIIPFTKLQEEIYAHVPESYAITVMRRMMYRLADRLAKEHHCHAIVNGESVGQVASQTLTSMEVINNVTNFPVIRPVATYDKIDIINLANKIDTYEISIRPYEDCCTIFTPKAPKTSPSLKEAIHFEETFDFESLIEEALKNVDIKVISSDDDLF